jgi:sugar/nucleoside kinase (ribokinase family)
MLQSLPDATEPETASTTAPTTAPTTGTEAAFDPVDLLLVGHVTCDLASADPQESRYHLGGTVSFAAVTALQLGRRPTIVTRAAATTDLSELPSGIDLHLLPATATTTFANLYTDHGRIQYSYSQAEPIRAQDIPSRLHRPHAVLLGPLVNEIGPDVAELFHTDTLVAAVPQGWMRQWDASGRVHAKPWSNAAEILPHLTVLVLSLEDIDFDLTRLTPWFAQINLIVLTEYRDGSTIYQRMPDGQIVTTRIPPRPADEVDPTGAGDVFATAFVIRLQETGDPIQAARFANVTASLSVEHVGVTGIPNRDQVDAYMADHPFDPTS